MLRVLIADSHPLMRVGVAQVLIKGTDAEVEQVGSIAELRDALVKRKPNVLVLELGMPRGNALETIEEIRRTHPEIGILVLSSKPEQHAGARAILAGAHGYLANDCPPQRLVAAVLDIASGGRHISSVLAASLARDAFHLMPSQQPHQALSKREYTVLLKISKGLTTAGIAEQLHLSPKTVGTYRARLLEKMRMSTTAELTRYVLEKGLNESPRPKQISMN